jgi:feruloyl esterase
MTRTAFASAILLVAMAAPVAAQNGSSFLDAATSAVQYSVTSARPILACADMTGLASAETTIVSARTIAAANGVPAHCRISGLIAPEIRFELNLPAAWNRRFYMNGNGGFAGETPEFANRPAARAQALRRGFATATTNTGHDATAEPLATFAASYQKRIDYAFRAVHLTAQEGKRLASAYYGRPAAFSYWDGCSTGGRQGLMEAQRFPQDFDGVLAGAPVNAFTDTVTQSLWNGRAFTAAPLSLGKMKTVADAVYARCDARDGLKDGVIDDPRKCDFDPARDVAQCTAGKDDDSCLTPQQITTLKKNYGGMVSNGKAAHFGYPVGAEAIGQSPGGNVVESGWNLWLIPAAGANQKSRQHAYGDSFVRYFAFPRADAGYDSDSFDFDKDLAKLDDTRQMLDAVNPDLKAFQARGGKLLMYFGWADTALPPLMGVDYYEKAVQANGPETPEFFRLFMVPGMFHCRGGLGTDRFDGMTALINWVENGTAPASLTARREDNGKTVRTRPLCPYPQVARYSGTGSVDEAANFACKAPE